MSETVLKWLLYMGTLKSRDSKTPFKPIAPLSNQSRSTKELLAGNAMCLVNCLTLLRANQKQIWHDSNSLRKTNQSTSNSSNPIQKRGSTKLHHPSLQSQSFSQSYGSILPTSLIHIVLLALEADHLGDLMRLLVRPNLWRLKRGKASFFIWMKKHSHGFSRAVRGAPDRPRSDLLSQAHNRLSR